MRYCKRCVQPDTRVGIYFEDGVCGACLYQDELERIDWNERAQELDIIARWAKAQRRDYDCVVGVSGGKDSTFQALYARDSLGLRVLLVNSEPECITNVGRHNIENLKQLGFDSISIRPNPEVMRKLMRRDFFTHLNPIKVTEYSLYTSAYLVALKFDIPLIIQGENAGLTEGVRHTLGTGADASDVWRINTVSLDCLGEYVGDDVSAKDLYLFYYDPEQIRASGSKAIWLQYYLKEWSPSHNAKFAMRRGLKIRQDAPHDIGTYQRYYQIDSDFVQVNQYLKMVKLGFGQCTPHACHDIRNGIITREEGIALVKALDGWCAERYINQLCDYIGISPEEFYAHSENWRGDMWEGNGLIDPVWEQAPPDVDVRTVIERVNAEVDSWACG